jgi:hypothetical protein
MPGRQCSKSEHCFLNWLYLSKAPIACTRFATVCKFAPFYRGSLSFLTLHISNMAISSFVVVYYIPYTLQWCGVGKMTVETDRLHAQDLQQCVNLHVCKFTLVCKFIFAMRLHGFNLRGRIFN